PNELRIAGLLRRVGEQNDGDEIAAIIIATDPNTTGEATSTYLARLLRPFPDRVVSRPASGLPTAADLECADELTLGSALSGRRVLSGGAEQPARSGGVLRPDQAEPAEAGRADSGQAETSPNAEPGRADAGPAAQSGQAAGSE